MRADDYNTVSLDEFMDLMLIIRGGDSEKKLKYAFLMHDADNSGTLSPSEIRLMLQAMLAPPPVKPTSKLAISGQLAEDRAREAEDAKRTVDKAVEDLLAALSKSDSNDDGKVSFEELLKAIKTPHDEGGLNMQGLHSCLANSTTVRCIKTAADSAFAGRQTKSSMCLVM